MSAQDDLTAAVGHVKAAIDKAVELIKNFHSGGSVSDEDVEAAVAQLEAAAGALDGATMPPAP